MGDENERSAASAGSVGVVESLAENELWAIRIAAAIVRAHASQIPARLGYHAEKCEADRIAMTLESLLDRYSPTDGK
jgi:hypothetical protein